MQRLLELKNISLSYHTLEGETPALSDISFSIEEGEFVAIVGTSGSGKSTMLKLIAGVMYPTKGTVTVNGEIAPLIELGAGFDLELTARENVFLNGAVLGHDRDYMERHFQNIIDFAEANYHPDNSAKYIAANIVESLTRYFGIPFITPQPVRAGVVRTGGGRLNLRDKPSTDAEIILKIPNGASVVVFSQWNDWYVIQYGGKIGYANARYVEIE